MDLDDFQILGVQSDEPLTSNDPSDAVAYIDNTWYSETVRRARWMDLVGDYAGNELFIVDGDSLLQLVLDDPLLALGRGTDISFQILHAKYILEKFLEDLIRRSAVFELAFFHSHRHLTQVANEDFCYISRTLARKMLMDHVDKLDIPVQRFQDHDDPHWLHYQRTRKPMFVMMNDGGTLEEAATSSVECILLQRVALFQFMSCGLPCALLKGVDFRDSKILTFVSESRVDVETKKSLDVKHFLSAIQQAWLSLQERERVMHVEFTPASIDDNSCDGDAVARTTITRFVNSASSILQSEPPLALTLLYIFTAHLLILPRISLRSRMRSPPSYKGNLKKYLRSTFLPKVFLALCQVDDISNLDVDGTLFIELTHFVRVNTDFHMREILGDEIFSELQGVWSACGQPPVDYGLLSTLWPTCPTLKMDPPLQLPESHLSVLPFSNAVFDKALSSIRLSIDESSDTQSDVRHEFDVPFVDQYHWHDHRRPILPKHLGGEFKQKALQLTDWQRQRKLRSEQRFMAKMQWQAESLTGASGKALQRVTIVAGGKGRALEAPKTTQPTKIVSAQNKKTLKKADMIRQQIAQKKLADQDTSDSGWWTGQLRSMESLPTESKIKHLERLFNNRRTDEGWLAVDTRLFRIHLEFAQWLEDPQANSDDDRIRSGVRDSHVLQIIRAVKDLYERGSLFPAAFAILETILRVLGFEDYATSFRASSENPVSDERALSFKFIKLVRSKTGSPAHKFMRITEDPIEWQMRMFGEFMDRSMDSQRDPRVSFMPDKWQVQLCDCVDRKESVLVVAPTSAGKTFISYYAMEQVLRNSDDDVVVYVAPTKALVSQIAAEVYARFIKLFKSTGKTCWSIHTRDYRVNDPQNCQILVTVPEMLAIMLLSPPLARTWTPRIKWIILDEIHTIGQQEGGAVWEQIILLAPCPIIGLSATIGEPEKFNTWLRSVQEAHGFQHTFIHHPHRYSHLRKFTYALDRKPKQHFAGLDTYQDTGRLRFLHPVSLLAFGTRTIPPDFSLEAADCLALYRALQMISQEKNIDLDISHLKPSHFFQQPIFLKQKDIIDYESALKKVLEQIMSSSDPADGESSLSRLVRALDSAVAESSIDYVPTRNDILSNLIHLASDLQSNGDLPALFFLFDRTGCEIVAQRLLVDLQTAEKKWRETSPKWASKIQQWRAWKAQAPARQKAKEKMLKTGKKTSEDAMEAKQAKMLANAQDSTEPSWEEAFDPKDPSPQFSFLGKKASRAQLEAAINDLHWTSTPTWVVDALRRGIGIHHSGMNKHYRTTVESLYRMGYLQVVFATGTLALGINAPTKTSVFCGDSPFLTALMYRQCAGRAGRRGFDLLGKVVFYGLRMDRVQRLVLSRLPSLGGNFPITSTMVLRLFNLLQGSAYAPAAIDAIESILKLPHVSFISKTGREEILHHIRFSIDYLRRCGLMDHEGNPVNLFGLATHLYYTEPSNFAIVALLRAGIIHDICNNSSVDTAVRELLLLLCHLFGRRYVPRVYTSSSNVKALLAKCPSKVILPNIPNAARKALRKHDREIVRIFTGYAIAFTREYHDTLDGDQTLPLSGKSYKGMSNMDSYFADYLQRTAINAHARSPFVGNSGNNDEFKTVEELVSTVRNGVQLKEHGIPSMQPFIASHTKHPLNAYLYDFYMHGQTEALVKANGIRRGEIWYLLQDFTLTLKTIRTSIEQLLRNISAAKSASSLEEQEFYLDTSDPAEMDDLEDPSKDRFERPPRVSDRDWKVFEVFDTLTREFDTKFRAMWA